MATTTTSRTRRWASLHTGAEYSELSVKTLRRRVADGTLTAYRVGPRTLRIDLDELDAALRPVPAGGEHDAA